MPDGKPGPNPVGLHPASHSTRVAGPEGRRPPLVTGSPRVSSTRAVSVRPVLCILCVVASLEARGIKIEAPIRTVPNTKLKIAFLTDRGGPTSS